MYQFYFLSIALNLFAGAVLIFSKDSTDALDINSEDSKKVTEGADSLDEGLLSDDLADSALDSDESSFDDDKKSENNKNIKDEKSKSNLDDLSRDIDDALNGREKKVTFFDAILCDKWFLLVSAFISLLVGFIKLACPIAGIPILGDFFPAIAGFAAGLSLLVKYLSDNTTVILPEIMDVIFLNSKKLIGLFCVAAALLHFICPGVIFF